MKKLTALLLSALMALSLTACGGSEPAPAPEAEDKTVVIGVDDTFAPMGFRDEAGELVVMLMLSEEDKAKAKETVDYYLP